METKEYKIVEGTFADKIESMYGLFEQHWDEVAKNKEVMVLKGNTEQYHKMEEGGNLFTLFAYHGDDLVGYSVNIVTRHLHYADLVYGMNDILFVTPEHRNSPIGLRLIRHTERLARDRGVKLFHWHAKQGTSLAKILPVLRYDVHEIVFSKVL